MKTLISFLILLLVCTSASAQQLRDTFRRVKSSVVIVRTGGDQSSPITSQMDDSGVGSGVLISKDGQILTAAHVVSSGLPITIEFTDGQRFKAQVVESSLPADLALLKVDRVPAAAAAATLGDSDVVETGDDIFIVGAPYGLSNTLTVGRISARRPDETRGGILSTSEFLQTDAVVNPGNSGSPVFNKAGEVIAIVSNVVSETGEFRFSFDTTAVTRLSRSLGWQVTLSDRYISNPIPGTKKNDLLLTTGLRVTLGGRKNN